MQTVLFGFSNKLALQLERFPSIHSDGYEFSGDRPICLANLPLNSKSFMNNAGFRADLPMRWRKR